MTIRNFVKDSLHKFYQKLNDYFEVLTNKVTSLSSSSTNDQYPSAKAVYDALTTKANLNSPALTGTPTAPTAAAGTNTTQIATTAFVQNAFATADAMIYKGTIAGGSTGTYGALTAAASRGWTYKVTTAGKIDGIAVEVGDMIICNTDSTAAATSSNYSTIAANWDFIQANIDGAVTGPASAVSGRIATFNGTSGKVIQDSSYTIATSVPSGAVFTDTKVTSVGNHYTPATDSGAALSASASGASAAWNIDVVKGVTLSRDAKGHVTGVSVTSGKIPANPNTDRYVNSAAFADDSTNTAASPVKMTLTRAGSDSATVTANIPKVSSSSAGVVPKGAAVSSQSQSTKFLREDGTWAAPSYTTNTDTYVNQSDTSTTNWRKVILSFQNGSAGAVVSNNTNVVYGAVGIEAQPSSGTLKANILRAANNDVYVGSTSGSQCHQQYDTTNKCLKFIFD